MIDLVGYNSQINNMLNNFKSKNLHNSIILHGPKGIGKRTFVNKLILEIFKINLEDKNYLHHINLFKKNTHPNVKIINKEIDVKSKKLKNYITIDQIRNLKQFVNGSPSIKNICKFIILDSADDLNINSANSFLKTLEEPNKNTFIFLISHQLSSLIPTIRSRCLKIKFNKHNYKNFKTIVMNEIEIISDDEIKFFYDLTFGSPGSTISLYEDNIEEVFDLTLNSFNFHSMKYNNELMKILSKFDNEKFKTYLSILKSMLIIIGKLKNDQFTTNNYLSHKFKSLKDISKNISTEKIIDRFDFLSNNENDLFTYNLDKKIFMLKFFTN